MRLFYWIAIDGQQRMTSCFSVFTNKGYYSYYINYIELMKDYKEGVTDYDFETLVVNKRHTGNLVSELSNGLFPLSYLIDRKTTNRQIQAFLLDNEDQEIDEFLNGEFRNIVDSTNRVNTATAAADKTLERMGQTLAIEQTPIVGALDVKKDT